MKVIGNLVILVLSLFCISSVIGHFCSIEKKMTEIESNEQHTGKTNKVLRLLSSSGERVEELKRIRKEYGAHSEEYKNAVTTLEK